MKASARVLVALFIFTLPLLAQDMIGGNMGSGGVLRGQILPAPGESQLPAIVMVRVVGIGFQQVTYVSGRFFSFQGLSDGDYTIHVSADGREEAVQEVPDFSGDRNNFVTVVVGNRIPERDIPPRGDSVVDLKTLQVPNKAKGQLQKGLESLNRQRFDAAARHFRAALDICPEFYQAHNDLGVALIKMKKPEEAENEFSKAVEIEPDNIAALKNLAYARMNLGQHRQAIDPLARALRLDSDDANAEMWLGEAYTMIEDLANAKQCLLKAVLLDPSLAHAHYRLGYIFLSEKQYDQALKHFKAYLKLDPHDKGKGEVQTAVAKLEQYFKDSLAGLWSNPTP
jgi:tetratricopeptide (TPR) repeat protein